MIEVRLPSFVLRGLLSGLEAPRWVKQAVMWVADIVLMSLCFVLAANWVKGWSPPYPVGL